MKISDPVVLDEIIELNRRESCAWIDAHLLGEWFDRCPRTACRCRLADSRADRFDWP